MYFKERSSVDLLFNWKKGYREIHSFFISIRVNWVETQYAYDFPNLSLKSCLMVCLISKLISWSDIAFDRNTAMVSFKYSNLNIQEFDMNNGVFNVRNLVSSLILMF